MSTTDSSQSANPNQTNVAVAAPKQRTPEQLLHHRRLQVGRLTLILLVAAVWIGYPSVNFNGGSQLAVVAPLLIGAIVSAGVWLWLLNREGSLRDPSTLKSIGKSILILAFWFILLGFLGSHSS